MNNKSSIAWVSVNLRNFKLWFLDILDIDIGFEDGTEVQIEDPDNCQFNANIASLEHTDKDIEIYDIIKRSETKMKNTISSIIENAGYGKVGINNIEYEIVEYIEADD